MSLWSHLTIPYLIQLDLSNVNVEDMTHWLMQGMDRSLRHYLAVLICHEGEFKVGFIVQKYPGLNHQWEYGLLGQMDTWTITSPVNTMDEFMEDIQIIRLGFSYPD